LTTRLPLEPKNVPKTRAATALAGKRAILLCGTVLLITPNAGQAAESQAAKLTNEGIKELHSLNFALAVQNLAEAVKLEPNNQVAKDNLVAAYNNYGLELKSTPDLALKQLHRALYLDPANPTTQENISRIIKLKRKNPESFDDRIGLAVVSRNNGDLIGAIIEYQAALDIKNDASTRIALADSYREAGKNAEAIAEYKKAILQPEMKLAAAYTANNQIADASAIFNQVLTSNPTDQQARDAFIAAWGAVKEQQPSASSTSASGINPADKRQVAIWEFSKALKLDQIDYPNRAKLAKQHIDCGWKISNFPHEALREFHRALVIDPSQRVTTTSMENAIRLMGKEPGKFDDRVWLAEQSLQDADWVGAAIEFVDALNIKEDAATRVKLGDLLLKMGNETGAAIQYKRANGGATGSTVSASN
jgi:tetratricopeptide (TPR) repeat protein